MAQAQDIPGMVARFDISQRLQYSDNPDLAIDKDSEMMAQTSLSFGLDSRTSVQSFSLALGGVLELGSEGPGGSGFNDPFLGLSYDRDVGSARFTSRLNYRETDVSSLVFNEDFFIDGNLLRLDTGKARTLSYQIGGEVGIDAPVGASLDLLHNERTYSGTTDISLVDTSTDTVNGRLNFRIDPRLTARVTALRRDYKVDGPGVDRLTTGYGVGAAIDVTPRLTADVSLSQDRIELSGDQTGVEEGLSFGLDLAREMANGSMGLTLSSNVTENGRRDTLRVSRDKETRFGALSLSLGLTQTDGAGLNPLYGVTYSHDLPRARLTAGLTQTVASDSDNNEQLNTALNIGYSQELTEISSLSASLAYFDTNQLGSGPGDEAQRLNLSLSYRHELTRDWGIVGGLSHARAKSSASGDRSSNTVFVGLNRSFSWNP